MLTSFAASDAAGAKPQAVAGRSLSVCLVAEATSGGVGRHVIDLARGLANEGVRTHLVVSPLRMSQEFRIQLDELQSAGLASHTLVRMERLPGVGDLGLAARVRSVIHRGGYDVVHLHSTKAGFVGRMSALGLGRGCVVYTPHAPFSLDSSRPSHLRRAAGWLERALSLCTDGIVAVSEEERAHLRSLGVAEHKLSTIHNGIDIPSFQRSLPDKARARAALSVKPQQACVGFVGRFDNQKNPELMLRSFSRVREQGIDTVLALVGWGELQTALRNLATALRIEPWVRWLAPQEALTAYAAADIFALTSRYEAMPYVLIEAAAAGLAIVTTRVGGASLTVLPGQSGIIVDGDGVDAFAAALVAVAGNPALRESFGINGERNARRFTRQLMVEKTIALYRTILERRRKSAAWPTAL